MLKGLAFAALAAAAWAQDEESPKGLNELLASLPEVSALYELLNSLPDWAELSTELKNVTVLVPDNGAITALNTVVQSSTRSDETNEYLENLLIYHVLNGTYDNITEYGTIPTLLTSPDFVNVTGGQVVAGYFDDEEGELGFYSGWDVHPGGANEPIPFDGGVLYIINGVLNLPVSVTKTVVGEEFNGTSFIYALNKTGLTEEVEALHDTTFFVPVDSGFEAVEDALANLTTEELAEILKYHVVPGVVGFYDVLTGYNDSTLTTLSGENITVYVTDEGEMFINGAGLVYADLILANGCVHLIDNVLNPNATVSPPANGTEEGVPAFEGANATASLSSEASGTTTLEAASTNMAAVPLMTGTAGAVAAFGGAVLAMNL